MNLNKKNVLVVGCGISGIGSTKLLEKVGANPILFDENKNVDPDAVRARFGEETKADIVIGELSKETENTIDLVVLVRVFLPIHRLQTASEREIFR